MLESFNFIFKSLPTLLEGAVVAIEITVLSMIIGLILGILIAFFRIYGNKSVQKIMYIYEWIFRGIPILVLLFIIYFGLNKKSTLPGIIFILAAEIIRIISQNRSTPKSLFWFIFDNFVFEIII